MRCIRLSIVPLPFWEPHVRHNADREPAIVITIILLLGLSIGPIKHFFGRGESHPRVFGINQLDQALERAPRVLTSKIANLVLVFRPPARVS